LAKTRFAEIAFVAFFVRTTSDRTKKPTNAISANPVLTTKTQNSKRRCLIFGQNAFRAFDRFRVSRDPPKHVFNDQNAEFQAPMLNFWPKRVSRVRPIPRFARSAETRF